MSWVILDSGMLAVKTSCHRVIHLPSVSIPFRVLASQHAERLACLHGDSSSQDRKGLTVHLTNLSPNRYLTERHLTSMEICSLKMSFYYAC